MYLLQFSVLERFSAFYTQKANLESLKVVPNFDPLVEIYHKKGNSNENYKTVYFSVAYNAVQGGSGF